uniref:Methylthioribose-1-phosphate isomerase n=1 Tax=Vitis vinifera TaxID=29760 RepID=F6HVT7_VITVI
MLREDVAANRATGLYGASFLRGHIKNSKGLSILTHCNTGSLAIAGYGTALDVDITPEDPHVGLGGLQDALRAA